jgi:hypothetical protein
VARRRHRANEHPARVFSLDYEPTTNAAREDAAGFVAAITGPVVIDEVQRVPSLLLAIKRRLDFSLTTPSPSGPLVSWPRVYADLKRHGGRGDDAAQHLRDVMESERG